jgi:NADPH:quinone reductase-like Zn-dependent oxidoreductase
MRAVMLTRKGGPEALELVEVPLPAPGPGEVRVRVEASGVGWTDIMMRREGYMFAPKLPFVPGYETVGVVDAVGEGVTTLAVDDRVCALLVYGGYATHVVRPAREWVVVPAELDGAEVAALVLNYVTAYQAIHRAARLEAGQTALVTAANGGVGQVLVELLRLVGVRVIAAAAARSHARLRELGAEPIEGRTARIDEATLALVPEGVHAAFDSVGVDTLRQCIRATRRGGIVVAYGQLGARTRGARLRGFFDVFVGTRLRLRRGTFYGITALYRRDPEPFREDITKLLAMLAARQISPRIAMRVPLEEARRAQGLLEEGGVDGKIVLVP